MKANEFDKKIKDQLKKVEQISPSDVIWDINKSWDKIARLLKQTSPKSIVWYLSLAASISMVMANVSVFNQDWSLQEIQESEKLAVHSLNTPKVHHTLSTPDITIPPSNHFSSIKSKRVFDIPAIIGDEAPISIPRAPVYYNEIMPSKTFAPRLNAGMGPSGLKLSGELLFITNKKINNLDLGMSIEMSSYFFTSQNQDASIANRSQQTFYINMIVLSDHAKRPWSARIGTPLWQTNAGDSSAPMLKMNYQTKIGKKLHFGPELIFTKGFKQVYPGISLSFG